MGGYTFRNAFYNSVFRLFTCTYLYKYLVIFLNNQSYNSGIAAAFNDKTEFNPELVEKCKIWFKVRLLKKFTTSYILATDF